MTARPGFSLVEILISLLLLGAVLAALGGLMINTQRAYTQSLQDTRAADAVRTTELTLATLLRSAGADPLGTGQATFDPDPTGSGHFTGFRARSDFNEPDRQFTGWFEDVQVAVRQDTLWVRWRAGDPEQAVAAPIRALEFQYYDEHGVRIEAAEAVAQQAVRVRILLSVAGDPGAPPRKSESWVFIRNEW